MINYANNENNMNMAALAIQDGNGDQAAPAMMEAAVAPVAPGEAGQAIPMAVSGLQAEGMPA